MIHVLLQSLYNYIEYAGLLLYNDALLLVACATSSIYGMILPAGSLNRTGLRENPHGRKAGLNIYAPPTLSRLLQAFFGKHISDIQIECNRVEPAKCQWMATPSRMHIAYISA